MGDGHDPALAGEVSAVYRTQPDAALALRQQRDSPGTPKPTPRLDLSCWRAGTPVASPECMRRARRPEQGFTLIELLTVVAIVSVLTAVAIPQYSRHKGKALEARIRMDLRGAALAQESFWDISGVYFTGPSCEGMPGLRLSGGTVCTVQRADELAYQMETSHPGTTHRCTWTSDTSPSLHCT